MKKIELEKLKLISNYVVAKTELDGLSSIELVSYVEMIGNDLVFELKTWILGQQKTIEIIKYPLNWIEALKERWLPPWLLKKYPVKYIEKTFNAIAMFPNLKVNNEKPIIKLVATE